MKNGASVPEDIATLVLVPGLLSDETAWQGVADALGSEAHVVMPELITSESITAMAEAVLAAVPGTLCVAGHSMGGRVALEIARLAPDRVQKLALADTGTHRRREGEADSRQAVIDLAHDQGMEALAERWLPPMVHPDRLGDDVLMTALTEMVLRNDAARHECHIRALLNRPEAEAVLPTITCPVLLMVGRQDSWSPLSQHEGMLAKLSNGRLVVIEHAGHFAPAERPEVVADAMKDWLRGWDG